MWALVMCNQNHSHSITKYLLYTNIHKYRCAPLIYCDQTLYVVFDRSFIDNNNNKRSLAYFISVNRWAYQAGVPID